MKKSTFWSSSEHTPSSGNRPSREGRTFRTRNEYIPRRDFQQNNRPETIRPLRSEYRYENNNFRTTHTTGNKYLQTTRNFFGGLFGNMNLSLKRIIGAILMTGVVWLLIVWGLFLRDLPDIKNIENPNFYEESTILYDKYGWELYSFSEKWKRTYVWYDQISQSIKDALVAAEDQWFFENPGVDIFGLFRAGVNYALGKNDKIAGTSTLSQQLIKNTLLTNERSLKRKVQEAYLAYQLNKEYSKEKILELYLNAIEFWNWANGVEQASITYFGKSAKDVWPLWASILASLPKSPTVYSPFSHRDKLMGKIEVFPTEQSSDRITLSPDLANGKYAPLYKKFKEYLGGLTFKNKNNNNAEICGLKAEYNISPKVTINSKGCTEINYADILDVLGGIQVTGNLNIDDEKNEKYALEYTVGRKDYVASQMFRYEKITGEVFGKIIYDWLEFSFSKPTQAMKYPYFVMYVKEQLEAKYGKDINVKTGLKVYTTIDPKLQEQAEKIVREQVEDNITSQWASSAALVSMDNTTGELLAMVGWPDYFDDKNWGNNNMTTAYRQPGSSFKPLVYGLAISKKPIWPESPVADVKTKFGTYEPDNYDRKFKGIMTVAKALAYSRNIPAVKMYFLAGQEKEIVNFVKKLGINSLTGDYGAALSLGAGEVRPIDMMQAYSVFANNWVKKDMFAIKRIVDSQWGIIEDHKESTGQNVFSPAAAYIINRILSDNENRPESTTWRNNLTIKWRTVAAKTGTANKPAKKWSDVILPGDVWTIGYSPNITTVVWAGNVDWSAMKGTCDGINCAAPAWNKFMTYALKDLPNTDFKAPEGLYTYETSKYSGLLSSNWVTNIMAVKLEERDEGWKQTQIDTLCWGPVTSDTPPEAIRTIYTPTARPVIDGYDPDWLKWFLSAADMSISSSGRYSNTPCERPKAAWNVGISSRIVWVGNNILEISWNGNRAISKFRVSVDGKVLKETSYDAPANSGADRISTTQISALSSVSVELIDTFGFKYSYNWNPSWWEAIDPNNPSLPSISGEESNIDPNITVTNPSRSSISVYSWDMFNLRFSAKMAPGKRSIIVTLDWSTIQSASSWEVFVVPIETSSLSAGNHSISISATDSKGKTDSRSISLSILPR